MSEYKSRHRNVLWYIRRLPETLKRSFGRLAALPKNKKIIVGASSAAVLAIAAGAVILFSVTSANAQNQAAPSITPEPTVFASENTQDPAQAAVAAATPAPTPEPTPEPTPTPDPTLKLGSKSDLVTKLQERLIDLNFLDIDESTDYFGPATEQAVAFFQRQNELDQDGVAGPQTQELLYSDQAKSYVMKEGMEGTDIDNLQRQLTDLGYMSQTTGYFGDTTTTALKDFQSRNNLSSDGKAGSETIDKLYSGDAVASETKQKEKRRTANVDTMIKTAYAQLGKKYILGNEGPNSFDCSGLVYYCLKQAGSNRNRCNAAGYSKISDWEKIKSIDDLRKGDLICFYSNNFSKVGHVGIYIGGGMMIDASSKNGKVVKRTCDSSYWRKHFVCGRRPW